MDKAVIQGVVPSPAEPVPDEFDFLCDNCGYSLLGLMNTSVCPECGSPFNPQQLPLARVPWLYRKRLGTFKAYWKTVWLILRDPRAFSRELHRPVRISAEDARQFRIDTVELGTLPFLLLGVLAALTGKWRGLVPYDPPNIVARIVMWEFGPYLFVIMAAICPWLFLTLATDSPTFIWKDLPNQPRDLAPAHRYASAPIAIAVVMLPLWFIAMAVVASIAALQSYAPLIHVLSGALLGAALLWLVCRTAVAFMREATGCSSWRSLILWSYLPIHWLMAAVLSICASFAIGAMALRVLYWLVRGWRQ